MQAVEAKAHRRQCSDPNAMYTSTPESNSQEAQIQVLCVISVPDESPGEAFGALLDSSFRNSLGNILAGSPDDSCV
jgi:hypothetical protein